MADLLVLLENDDYFGAEKIGKNLTELWWLNWRLLYETLSEEKENAMKYSFLVDNLLEEINKMMNSSTISINNKLWSKKLKDAIGRTEMEWFEGKKRRPNVNEIVQKWHMENLKKFSDEKETNGQMQQIIEELKNSSENRKNLLQILTMGDAKEFLKIIGAEFDKFEKSKKIEENENNNNKGKGKNNKNKKRNNKKKIMEKEWQKVEKEKEKGESSTTKKDKSAEEKRKSDENENENKKYLKLEGQSSKSVEKSEENETEASNLSVQTVEENEQSEEKWWKIEKKKTGDTPKQKQLSAEIENGTLSDLCDDEPLFQKYKNVILNFVNQNATDFLSLCALKNEIENRIAMLFEINKIIFKNNYEKQNLILQNLEERKGKLSKMKMEKRKDLFEMEDKLYEILREILILQNGKWKNLSIDDSKIHEILNLKKQIHLKNLLLAFEEEKELAKNWTKFGIEEKWRKLNYLLKSKIFIKHFEELRENYRKMGEQIEIDEELFTPEVLANCLSDGQCLRPNFPKISQQITVSNKTFIAKKAAENFERYMTLFVYKSVEEEKNYQNKIEGALQQIVTVVDKWSNGNAHLIISGSLLLSSHSVGSDVNLLCLTPGEKLKVADFMGNNKKSKCVKNECTEETNASLFCQICEHKNISNLYKIESDSILIVSFQFDGIEFDISLVAIPKMEQLDTQKINAKMLENFLGEFNGSIIEQKNMNRTLASYCSTLYLANLFYESIEIDDCMASFVSIMKRQKQMRENGRNFRHLLMTIKFWAKNNYIYSNKMGFLNGMALAIMVAKIVLLYPNSSLQFLVEMFFLIYSTRPQQIPIQLTKIDHQNANVLFTVNPKELEMPIFTPTFSPLPNATRFVTHSNAKVIRREMAQALKKINSLKNGAFELAAFLSAPIPFREKYSNFLAINCVAAQKELGDSFCAFVEWRMRLQIIFDIDKKGGAGVQTHLNPNIYQEKCNLSAIKLLQISFRPNFCKTWLIGIISDPINAVELRAMANQFDSTIKSHFHKMSNRENSVNYWLDVATKLELKTMLMKREEIFKLDEEKEK